MCLQAPPSLAQVSGWLACCGVVPPALTHPLLTGMAVHTTAMYQTLCCGVGAPDPHPVILSDLEVMFFSIVAVSEARRS